MRDQELAEAERVAAEQRFADAVARARQEGFGAGREAALRDASESREQAVAMTMASLEAEIVAQRAASIAVAEESAEAVARAVFAFLRAVAPAASERFGDAEVKRFVEAILPTMAEGADIVVRVGEGLSAAVSGLLKGESWKIIEEASIRPGDCHIEWKAGSAVRNAEALASAAQKAVEALGLLEEGRT